MENRWTGDAAECDPIALDAAAHWLESQAQGLWLYARDCDCWGLVTDADEARSRTRQMRVDALLCRARSASLRFAEGGAPELS